MGLFDAIKDAAGSAVHTVADAVSDPQKAARELVHKVERAPAAIARGAGQAVEGARNVTRKVVESGAKLAKDGADLVRKGPKEVLAAAGRAAKATGKWAWDHKAEIGFWVGTTALMLAVPVSGGASGALAGGLMAARGAAIAAKVAQAGKVGLTAVKVARAGAAAVNGARTVAGATRVGAVAVRGGQAVRAGRIALGGTRVGRGMIAAQKPVTAASTVIAGVNFADTSRRFAKGDASVKDLALSTLGFAPAGVGSIKGMAARRAASANAQAAKVATGRLDDVAAKAADATDEVAHVAHVAPTVNAPRTAGAAATARTEASDTIDLAVRLRDRTAITSRSTSADDAISASSLADELDDVAAQASTARRHAASAEELAPDALTPAMRTARDRLDEAAEVATRTRQDIGALVTTQQRADRLADGAEAVQDAIGTTAMHAGIVNNGVLAAHERSGSGWSLTDGSFARGIASWVLGRNARVPVAIAAAPAAGVR